MNAASLHIPARVPVAASPVTPGVSGGGGVTPMANQGFVPVGAAGSSAAPSAGAAAPVATSGAAPSTAQGIPAETALKALVQALGDAYGEPIIAADGSVYMEKKTPEIKNGKLALTYVLVGKIDRTSGTMVVAPAILEQVKAKASNAAEKQLVKVGDQYTWQTFTKGEDGKVTAQVVPATEEELKAHQAKLQAEESKKAAAAKAENSSSWQQKIGVVAQGLGVFGSTGQLISGLSAGPNALTGKPGAGWISGWILAQRLNGVSEGKLLPKWVTSGPVATALEWAIQGYGMLDMGNDIRTLKNYFSTTPLPATNKHAIEVLSKQGMAAPMAAALEGLGKELRVPLDSKTVGAVASQLVDGTGNATLLRSQVMPKLDSLGKPVLDAAGNAIAGEVKTGLTMVAKSDLHKAIAATDPIQDAGLKLRGNIDSGVYKGLGMLKGLVQPAMMGATALGLISSTINVKNLVEKNGASVLVNNQQGRGALLGALSSAAFLGMYVLPMVLPGLGVAGAAVAAASSAVNLTSNVLGGVQLLNSYGLFGGEGFLNHDAFRGAFLIPPLTPIGAFAFWQKSKKKAQDAEAAKLQAAQQVAVQRVADQREMVKLQLQNGGSVSGATPAADGSISVMTTVPNDLKQLAAQLTGVGTKPAPAAAAASPKPAA